jgi:hypothetical protein
MTVKVSIIVVWVVMLYGLLGGYQHFGGMYCLHIQGAFILKLEAMINILKHIYVLIRFCCSSGGVM